MRTYVRAIVQACIRAFEHAGMLACMHSCIRTYVHACVRACWHTGIQACLHTGMLACVRACMCACVHVCMHACVCVRARASSRERATSRPRPFQCRGDLLWCARERCCSDNSALAGRFLTIRHKRRVHVVQGHYLAFRCIPLLSSIPHAQYPSCILCSHNPHGNRTHINQSKEISHELKIART